MLHLFSWSPRLAVQLEGHINGRLKEVSFSISAGSDVGWRIYGANGVAGSHEKVCQSLSDTGGCVTLSLFYMVTVEEWKWFVNSNIYKMYTLFV